MTEHTFSHGGTLRAYRVYRPAGYRAGGRAVVLLHGGAQSMRKIFVTGANGWPAWREVADRENTLLIIPNGIGMGVPSGQTDTQRWNDLRFPGETLPDDTDFLATTLRRVARDHAFDPKKLHAFGSSSGGLMLLRALLERPELVVSGAAALAALPEAPPKPNATALPPILFINGDADPIVRAAGGTILDSPVRMRPVADSVRTWETLSLGETSEALVSTVHQQNGYTLTLTKYPEAGTRRRSESLLVHAAGHHLPSRAYPPRNDALTLEVSGPGSRAFETAEVAHAFFLKSENRR